MDTKNILTIALRIGAIIILVNVLSQFPTYYSDYLSEGAKAQRLFILLTVIPSAFSVVMSILMWFYPQFFLKYFFIREKTESENHSEASELATFLIGIIGLYILITAIADMFYHTSFVYEGRKIFGSNFELTPQNRAEIFATIVEIVLGGLLIFGNKIFSKLISRFRFEMKKDSL